MLLNLMSETLYDIIITRIDLVLPQYLTTSKIDCIDVIFLPQTRKTTDWITTLLVNTSGCSQSNHTSNETPSQNFRILTDGIVDSKRVNTAAGSAAGHT